jgi:hypothetical protein
MLQNGSAAESPINQFQVGNVVSPIERSFHAWRSPGHRRLSLGQERKRRQRKTGSSQKSRQVPNPDAGIHEAEAPDRLAYRGGKRRPLQLTLLTPSAIRLPLGYWFMRMPPT